MPDMKSALVYKTEDGGTASRLIDTPQPSVSSIKPNQLIIKVNVSGSNPKDWKLPLWVASQNDFNTGDDIAGTVVAVGDAVSDFKVGDRVAAFHEMTQPWGSFAEYAVAWEHTTLLIPKGVSDEEASTIPLAAMTAVVGLYDSLALPEPWVKKGAIRERAKGGVVVYGAASAVGAFVIKLLMKSDLHPIIAVAGNGIDFVERLIDRSKGDTIVDYRKGGEAIVQGLRDGTKKGEKLRYAYDAVSDHGSYGYLSEVLDKGDGGSELTVVLPGKKFEGIPDGVNLTVTSVGSVHQERNRELGYAWFRLFAQGLKDGWFSGHPHEVISGGLAGVGEALSRLQQGKVSATKFVFRIADTEGLGGSKI